MNIFFNKCVDAIAYTNNTKSYGVYFTADTGTNTDMHVHECCEVFMCLDDGKNFLIDERVYDVKRGDIFLINQFESHKVTFEKNKCFSRIIIQIHPTYLYANSTENTDLARCFNLRNADISNKLETSAEKFEELKGLFFKLKGEYEYGDDILKNAIVNEILVSLNSEFVKSCKYVPTEYGHSAIRKSIDYINENLSESLSLPQIAKNSFVSVNQLCRLFKNNLGTTVTKYIISRRITEAKKLLKKGTNVSETALSCGFSDYANFIRTFKNTVGVSPGKYLQTLKRRED